MKLKRNLLCLFIPSVMATASLFAQTVTLTFDDQTIFDTQWPTQEVGGSSSISLSSGKVVLKAQGSGNVISGICTSASLSSSFNFISSGKTITFSDVSFAQGLGTSYNAAFGITNAADADLIRASSITDAVYFMFSRPDQALYLIQRTDSVNTTLATFDTNGYDYTSLELSITSTTWAVSGTASDSSTISASGNLATTITSSNWGDEFYVTMTSQETSQDSTRIATLSASSVSVSSIPEASTIWLLAAMGAGILVRRRKA
ncbi:MAG: PEP-CTERM sorting domain-containing protein [Verrucomicrobiota bacterium JB024]|nr:PEP-CTERM sorting domain-containing protein [Verrucomicrobiota bacterium JB024]